MSTTPTLLPRSSWTAHGPARPLTVIPASLVAGIACHWPGTTGPIGDSGQAASTRRLEGYRSFHTAPPPVGRGWNDIAYSFAIDQGGRVFDLRGIRHMSAANGTYTLNERWLACLFLIGPGEQPTRAALDAFVWFRTTHVLTAYPKATRVLGHQDVRPDPTACPGPLLEAHIRAGDLTKTWAAAGSPPAPAGRRLTRVLRRGVTGADVAAWQKRINAEPGIADLRVDGDFGVHTEDATMDFQRKHGLARDGVVGRLTCKAAGWTWAG